jgi:NAD(P)-dependent dehydrogenase (short-subunit alcohol dehydrogenase family)
MDEMTDPDSTRRSADPVAAVLLDFQVVMAEFLELQVGVLGALANSRRPGHAPPLTPTVPAEAAAAMATVLAREHVREPFSVATDAAAAVVELAPIVVEPVESTIAPNDPASFSRHTLTWRDQPLGSARAGIAGGHTVVLTDDGRGIAAIVADRLRSEGHRVAIVADRDSPDASPDRFVSRLDSPEEAARVTRAITEACGPVAGLMHLAPLAAAPPFDTLDATEWWHQLSRETRALFLLAQALGGSLDSAARNGGAAIIAVTSMGGTFGSRATDTMISPSHGGVVGVTKCLAIEWPEVRVRAVDVDSSEPIAALAAQILDELSAVDSSPEVSYVKGRRVAVTVEASPAPLDPSFVIASDAVILATGGARGITAEVCLELAERFQPTLVLVGHSPLPPLTEPADVATLATASDLKRALTARLRTGGARVTPALVEKAYRQLLKEREIRGTISRLGAAGARVHYVQLDVQDEAAFSALIDEIYATYGRLDGVIHGAGIIEDKLVRDKPLESFDRVLRTKVMSAFTLSRRLKPESLRFLVFFSSVAGRFGNRGQADYAAANEVVSKLAVTLQARWPGRVCAIAWAPWDKLGMVSPELKREFSRRGVELLAPVAGRRAFWHEIQQAPAAAAEVVVGGRAATPLVPNARPQSLPLLHHATPEASAVDAMRLTRLLDPSVDLYLNDHRLDGRPVLPLAFATEFMAEAAQAAFPDLTVIAVRDLQLLKGIVVEATPVQMVVTVRSAVHSNEQGVTEVDVDISTPALKPPLRYRAVVQMAAGGRVAPVFDAPAWPITPLGRSLEAAYQDWTFHGPLFQRVTALAGTGSDSMIATIYSASAIPVIAGVDRPEWIIDPFVFDAALQLLLIWSRAHHDKTALPSRFHAFTRYRSLADQPLTCYVAVESLADGHALKSNVHFVDAEGGLVGMLDTMEASCTSALNRLAGIDTRDEGRS